MYIKTCKKQKTLVVLFCAGGGMGVRKVRLAVTAEMMSKLVKKQVILYVNPR